MPGGRSLLLAIETAGSRCSAAVTHGETILAAESRALRHGHGEALLPMIDRVVTAAGLRPAQLEIVAAATGPGGFTGIRVGLAAAHGIALAAGARLVGVSSFEAVAARLGGGERTLLVALDSRREDFYVQLFAPDGLVPLAPPQAVLPEDLAGHIERLVAVRPLLLAGDAAAAVAAVLGKGTVAPDSAPDALGVAAACRRMQRDEMWVPVRPLYLRPPDVSLPKRPPPAAIRR